MLMSESIDGRNAVREPVRQIGGRALEIKMAKRGPVGQPEEVERRIRQRGVMGSTRKDNRSSVLKALGDVIVREHGLTCEEDVVDDICLPGIPNHVTFAHIIPKLCWKDTLHLLRSISRTWLHLIQSRQIFAERIFHRCTETFIVLPYFPPLNAERLENYRTVSIALYSMTEDRWYELPPLPPFPAFFPGFYWHTSVSLDGKVYVIEVYTSIGGCSKNRVTGRMLAFDVAGQGGWQPCANRQILVDSFKCGVLNGKIYAIDGGDNIGTGNNRFKGMSEVYNPQDNTWSWMKTSKYQILSDPVWVLGDKLVVRSKLENETSRCDYLQVYDPTAEEWTELKISLSVANGFPLYRVLDVHQFEMFTSDGKLYMMDAKKIYIYDSQKDTWKCLHLSCFTGIEMGPVKSLMVVPEQVLVVGEDLVAIVSVLQTANSRVIKGQLVIRSRSRLGGENKEIVWQRAGASYGLQGMASALHI